jgi:hypothetical protein
MNLQQLRVNPSMNKTRVWCATVARWHPPCPDLSFSVSKNSVDVLFNCVVASAISDVAAVTVPML